MTNVTAITTIKGILFDLDGTLLNTLDDLAEAMNFALRRGGLPAHPVDAYRFFVGDGIDLLVRRACAPVADEGIVKQCAAEFQKRYAVCWSRRTAPYNGIEAMLDELESGRLFLAVLSNKPHTTTTEVVRHYFAGRHFTVCMGNGIFPRKPDPEASLYIASIMGIKPANCLYVGDSGTDMQTALAAGMPAAGALWGFREERELREKGAWWIVERPADVVEIVKCSNGEW
ncbi:MAG: HAD family hydrolase [Chitinispirillaceae bacterium]|nr:HAD family hydrolase [Chitinispirillaceae bacterium]